MSDVVPQITEVPCLHVIRPRADSRQVDWGKVKELEESLQRFGLLNPIILRRSKIFQMGVGTADGFELIAGRHRHAAAIALKWPTIPARIIEADDIEAELAMISENLHRSDLTALQRSQGIARWVCLTTESWKDEKRQVDAKPGRPTGGVRGAARELGISEPDARRSVKIASLSGQAQAAAVEEGLDDNSTALLAAARESDAEKQVEVIAGWGSRNHSGAAEVTTVLIEAANDNAGSKAAYRTSFTGNNEWYTPASYVELARSVMGAIDTDPASNEFAQKTVKAGTYYTQETNGLDKEWHGKVWMNPPYSQPEIVHFIEKLIAEYKAGRVSEAVVLTHNSTDTRWFEALASVASACCLTSGRIRFVSPAGEFAAPAMGQAFNYLGSNPDRFAETFSTVGNVYAPLRTFQRRRPSAEAAA